MTGIPTLETARLILRAQRPDDTELLIAAFADDDFARFITREKRGLDRTEAWRMVALGAGSWAARGFGQWIAEERATGHAIGRIGPWEPEGWPGFEIAWSVFPPYQGKGYAVEGAAAAIIWAHQALGRDHVIHLIDPGNKASERVAAALGGAYSRTWIVPTGEEIPVWTTRWKIFAETAAYKAHMAAAA